MGEAVMKKMKEPKLIREINEIINNPDLHFWIKCKQLTLVKTYDRPGSEKGRKLIRKFFKTCAGKYQDRFESAYVRPFLEAWFGRTAHDYVHGKDLDRDLSAKIGRNPRGIKIIASLDICL